MIHLLIVTYMLLLPVTLIALLIKILNKVSDLEDIIDDVQIIQKNIQEDMQANIQENVKSETNQDQKQIRKHVPIAQSDFDNVFGGRKAYEIYKNKDGLYEPVTPSKGIPIKKKEE